MLLDHRSAVGKLPVYPHHSKWSIQNICVLATLVCTEEHRPGDRP